MRGKGLFWLGMGLDILSVALIVFATRNILVHAVATLLMILGTVLAVRNYRT